jgi:hypothetical protein
MRIEEGASRCQLGVISNTVPRKSPPPRRVVPKRSPSP